MKEKRRILIVEDHTLLRAGLSALLSQDPDIEIAGELDNGRDAVTIHRGPVTRSGADGSDDAGLQRHRGDRGDQKTLPAVRILVLTLHRTEEYIHESLRAGADGYILKDATHDELRVAIRSVLNGKTYLSPDISGKVITGYLGAGKGTQFDVIRLGDGHPPRAPGAETGRGGPFQQIHRGIPVPQRENGRKAPLQPDAQAGSPQCLCPDCIRNRKRPGGNQCAAVRVAGMA